jgi:hypothetical protein
MYKFESMLFTNAVSGWVYKLDFVQLWVSSFLSHQYHSYIFTTQLNERTQPFKHQNVFSTKHHRCHRGCPTIYSCPATIGCTCPINIRIVRKCRRRIVKSDHLDKSRTGRRRMSHMPRVFYFFEQNSAMWSQISRKVYSIGKNLFFMWLVKLTHYL